MTVQLIAIKSLTMLGLLRFLTESLVFHVGFLYQPIIAPTGKLLEMQVLTLARLLSG